MSSIQELTDTELLRVLFAQVQVLVEAYEIDLNDMPEAEKTDACFNECRRRLYDVPVREWHEFNKHTD